MHDLETRTLPQRPRKSDDFSLTNHIDERDPSALFLYLFSIRDIMSDYVMLGGCDCAPAFERLQF